MSVTCQPKVQMPSKHWKVNPGNCSTHTGDSQAEARPRRWAGLFPL